MLILQERESRGIVNNIVIVKIVQYELLIIDCYLSVILVILSGNLGNLGLASDLLRKPELYVYVNKILSSCLRQRKRPSKLRKRKRPSKL